MKKIYPIDWKKTHPDNMAMSTDRYYVDLANKVLNVLQSSGIEEVFPDDETIFDTALRLTAWFEDICSQLGFWRTVNETCQQRYGKPLPFYDTTEYYPGEPNPQDIQLLLWDIIQSLNDDRFINPENPGILWTANEIYKIFDEEYETAPETGEMIEYFADPAIGTDYWQTRRAFEWLSKNGYMSLHSSTILADALINYMNTNERPGNEGILYAMVLGHVMCDRHNLLSLTAPEWLSAATRRPFTLDTSRLINRYYTIEARYATTLQIRDKITDEDFIVEEDSFDEGWFAQYGNQQGLAISCGIVFFNDKTYLAGTMVTYSDARKIEDGMEKLRQEDYRKSLGKSNYDLFYEASGGHDIVFLRGATALREFYTQKAGITLTPDFERQLEEAVYDKNRDGYAAVMATRDQGFLIISLSIPAIKSPDNPYYDAEYAKKHAHDLMLCSDAIDYSAACLLLQKGYLADAALTSLQGYEHGRQLLQNNAQFVVDYMFAQHQ